MASLLTSTTPSPTLPSPSSGGFSSPLSSPRPSNASPAGLPSRLPSTSTRSRTASRRGTNPISVSLAKGLLANQAAQTLTSPVVVEGEQGPPAVLLAPDAPPADRFATWGNFGRPWDVDSPSSSRRSSLAAGDSSGGRSSRRQSRSRRSMASSDGGPLDPPFTEGDVLTPYQSLPASASSAPLLPVRSPAASHFGGSTESNTASPEGTVDGEAASSSASGEADIRSLEIVRKLGVGSYAVVYLVREVIADKDSPSSDDDLFDGLDGDDVAAGARRHRVYGREFGASPLRSLNVPLRLISQVRRFAACSPQVPQQAGSERRKPRRADVRGPSPRLTPAFPSSSDPHSSRLRRRQFISQSLRTPTLSRSTRPSRRPSGSSS